MTVRRRGTAGRDCEITDARVVGRIVQLLTEPRARAAFPAGTGTGYGESGYLLILKDAAGERVAQVATLRRSGRLITDDHQYVVLDPELVALVEEQVGGND